MAESINEVHISGNLGGDAEMRYTSNGSALTTFSVAVTEHRPTGQTGPNGSRQLEEHTSWIRVTCWGGLAEEVGPRLRRGNHVEVKARLQSRSWQVFDQGGAPQFRADGKEERRYELGVVAKQVKHRDEWLSGHRSQGGRGAPPERGPDARYESGYAPGQRPPAAPERQFGGPDSSDPDDLPFE
jgi:single-strand DNA-binding protein